MPRFLRKNDYNGQSDAVVTPEPCVAGVTMELTARRQEQSWIRGEGTRKVANSSRGARCFLRRNWATNENLRETSEECRVCTYVCVYVAVSTDFRPSPVISANLNVLLAEPRWKNLSLSLKAVLPGRKSLCQAAEGRGNGTGAAVVGSEV